ncbi:MAG: hypothetical protein Q9201_000494 [Fulgogasparrea decipioides]
MAESVHQPPAGAKPPLKRQLFAKPTWAQNDHLGNSTDFFRRSNQSYLNIAAEEERKRQRKLARKQREQARHTNDPEPSGKRRRTSSDSDSDNESDCSGSDGGARSEPQKHNYGTQTAKANPDHEKRFQTPSELKPLSNTLSKTYENAITATKSETNEEPPSSNIIELDDEDSAPEADQDDLVEVTAVKCPEPPEEDDEFAHSDDEFAELARQAREKARRKRLEADILNPSPDLRPSVPQDDHHTRTQIIHEPTPPPAPPDPIVSILITSSIADTEPLIVNRKVSQRLKDVRLCWCQRQGFTEEFTTTVFLTWRGNRLFDVSTCRSLGIGVDSNGNIVTKGQKDVLGEEERQVHMVAMTEEILEEFQKSKRLVAREPDRRETGMPEQQPPTEEKKELQLRIILKAKGYTDFKLIVKPVSTVFGSLKPTVTELLTEPSKTTNISRIVNAFKLDKNIDDGQEVFLSFDGNRLAPESQVSETELDDMDYIDVYIKQLHR